MKTSVKFLVALITILMIFPLQSALADGDSDSVRVGFGIGASSNTLVSLGIPIVRGLLSFPIDAGALRIEPGVSAHWTQGETADTDYRSEYSRTQIGALLGVFYRHRLSESIWMPIGARIGTDWQNSTQRNTAPDADTSLLSTSTQDTSSLILSIAPVIGVEWFFADHLSFAIEGSLPTRFSFQSWSSSNDGVSSQNSEGTGQHISVNGQLMVRAFF